MLPEGVVRSMWFALGQLILVAICGYFVFLCLITNEGPDQYEDLLISSIFLTAAVFTAVICRMSYSTAKDISRIALLEYHARIDSLTELFNRGYTMLLLQKACRSSSPRLSVLLLDIDGFKEINDTFGHQAGDTVLQRFASLLTSLHAEPSFAGRYGGDEFVVVLPHTDMTEACAIAARIREAAETIDFGERSLPITVSIGVAASNGLSRLEADELLARADEALYRAKRGGRNQVAGSHVSSPHPVFAYTSVPEDAEASRSVASPLQLAD
jgi:diguanylate cyclase (GGDEF)-like protein